MITEKDLSHEITATEEEPTGEEEAGYDRAAAIKRADKILTSTEARPEDLPELVKLMIEITEGQKLAEPPTDQILGTTTFVPTDAPGVTIELHHRPEGIDTLPGGDASIIVRQDLSVGIATTKISYGRDVHGKGENRVPMLTRTVTPHDQEDMGIFGESVVVPAGVPTTETRPLAVADRQKVLGVFEIVRKLPRPEERVTLPGNERPTASMIGAEIYNIVNRPAKAAVSR